MTLATSYVEDAAAMIRTQLEQLDDDRQQLVQALETLGVNPQTSTNGVAPSATPTKPTTSKHRRTRRAGRGKRSAQALKVLRETPGLTGRELSEKMGISPQNAYQLLSRMTEQGLTSKKGNTYFPEA